MPLVLTTTVAPASEPIALADAKDHLRVDGVEQDDLIGGLIVAAREYCEAFTGRQFVRATLRLKLDRFPCADERFSNGEFQKLCHRHGNEIVLPSPPLAAVSSITYVDADGATQTLSADAYTVDADSQPGRVHLAYGESWPSVRCQPNAVTITYTAGWADADAVPVSIKQAMKLLVGHWYENREAASAVNLNDIPLAVESLLWSQRAGVL